MVIFLPSQVSNEFFLNCNSDESPLLIELSNIIIAPFDSVQSFYLFYQQLRNEEREVSRDDAEAKEPASLSTFRRAFRSLNDKVRLLTAKGSFKTCSVCNVINNLLNNAGNIRTLLDAAIILLNLLFVRQTSKL